MSPTDWGDIIGDTGLTFDLAAVTAQQVEEAFAETATPEQLRQVAGDLAAVGIRARNRAHLVAIASIVLRTGARIVSGGAISFPDPPVPPPS